MFGWERTGQLGCGRFIASPFSAPTRVPYSFGSPLVPRTPIAYISKTISKINDEKISRRKGCHRAVPLCHNTLILASYMALLFFLKNKVF
jgi:hypothetical protein